jgi:Family of unknown function (DUF5681)
VIAMADKPKGGNRDGDRANEEKPYRVGRGHPPKETRWKPGQSGNPKGRGKKRPSFFEVTEQVLNENVEMRVGDRVLRMSNRHALVRSAVRQALAGKPRLLTVLPAIMRYESEILQGQGDATLNLAEQDEAILADFLARHKRHKANETPADGDNHDVD